MSGKTARRPAEKAIFRGRPESKREQFLAFFGFFVEVGFWGFVGFFGAF